MYKSHPYLQKGDKIGIISPSSIISKEKLERGVALIREHWEMEPILGKHTLDSWGTFAGKDEDKLSDIEGFLTDSSIKAIICSRGGYGISRYIDSLKIPVRKWVVGFSDVTAFHLHIHQQKAQSIHGAMLSTFYFDSESTERLKNLLLGKKEAIQYTSKIQNKEGKAKGILLGGNLCLLAHSIGSKSFPDLKGKILLLEDVGEPLYNIDRMIVQLKRAKVLEGIAGLIIGGFNDIKSSEMPFIHTLEEIILEHLGSYSFPISFHAPFGHEKVNFPLIFGHTYHMHIDSHLTQLTPHV